MDMCNKTDFFIKKLKPNRIVEMMYLKKSNNYPKLCKELIEGLKMSIINIKVLL